MKAKYFKDTLKNDKKSYFIAKTIGDGNKTKVIYAKGWFEGSSSIWGKGAINSLCETMETCNGHHIIEKITEKEARNYWLYDI